MCENIRVPPWGSNMLLQYFTQCLSCRRDNGFLNSDHIDLYNLVHAQSEWQPRFHIVIVIKMNLSGPQTGVNRVLL